MASWLASLRDRKILAAACLAIATLAATLVKAAREARQQKRDGDSTGIN